MTNSSNKFYFYAPFGLILITLYRNSVLPGAKILVGKDIFVLFVLAVFYLLIYFDFNRFFSIKINIFRGNRKFIFSLIALLFFSTLFYNIQEITNIEYLIRNSDLIFDFIIFYIIIPGIIFSEPDYFKKLVLIVSYTGLITAVIGFFMYFLNIDNNYSGFMISFIGHPNYVPVIFNVGIISSLYYFDWQKDNLSQLMRYFFVFSILIQLLANLLTLTRAGYIGLAAGLLVYFLFKYRYKFLLLAPFLLLIGVFVIPPFFQAKGFGSFISRFYLLIPAFSMMTRSTTLFLWGYGISNTFKEYLLYNIYNYAGEYYINNPHNALVSSILMFGIIFTLVILIFIFLLLLKFSIRSLKTDNAKTKLFYAYLVAIEVSYLFLSLFDSSILMPEFFNIQLFLIILGIMNYQTKPNDGHNSLVSSLNYL